VSRITLYGRDGCHLCDDARAVLDRVGEPYDVVDIESDDDLLRRYLERSRSWPSTATRSSTSSSTKRR
jgi:glutaredoxin